MPGTTRRPAWPAGLLALLALACDHDPQELRRSLGILLGERLGLEYRIEREELHLETDQRGAWCVSLESARHWEIAKLQGIGLAVVEPENDKIVEFRRMLRSELLPPLTFDLREATILVGEFALGPGSICQTVECNILVFLEGNRQGACVMIWTI